MILHLPADEGASPPLSQIPDGVPIFYKPFQTEEVLAAIYAALISEGVPNGTVRYTPQP